MQTFIASPISFSTNKSLRNPNKTLCPLPNLSTAASVTRTVTRSQMALQADLDHIALDCKSPPLELVDFYTNVFGFAPYRVDEFKQGNAPFPSVRVSPVTILDFFEAKDPDSLPKGLRQSNHFCFAVSKPHFDQLLTRLKHNGIEIIDGPAARSGARGDGTSIYVKDPDANVVEFRYYPEIQEHE